MKAANQSSILHIIPLMLTMALLCPFTHGKIIYVDDDGQADYSKIQVAVDDANDGDVILVRSGIYNILSDIVVDVNCSLQIDPDTLIQFAPSTGLTIDGVLQAQGTADQKIIFTSNSDVPAPGDWDGIKNYGVSQEMSLLDYVEISFAKIGLDIKSSYGTPKMVVQNSEIYENEQYGVKIESYLSNFILADDVQILKNSIYSNSRDGIYLLSYSNGDTNSENSSYVGANEIYYNKQSGIHLHAYNGNSYQSASSKVGSEIVGNHINGNDVGISSITDKSYNIMEIAAKITNNLITGNTDYGLRLLKGLGEKLYPQITNNTIAGNGLGGILHHQQPTEGFVISNNIITGNGIGVGSSDTFDPEIVTDCFVTYNNVFGNKNGNWVNYPDVYGDLVEINLNGSPCDISMNVSVDPCFVDPGYWDLNGTLDEPKDDFWVEGDYHLTPCSPCIDSGDPNYIGEANEKDMDGYQRVIGGRIDIGAYEYPFVYDKPDEGTTPGSWWKYSENPVFSAGGLGEWDYGIKSISVLKDSEDPVAKYKMWYVGGESPFFEGAGIGYATSSDGINWIRNENNPVLEPVESWDAEGFSGLCVIKDGPIYKLWYEGIDNETAHIGYATSSDGINWDINNSNPVFSPRAYDAWDNEDVGNPCVIKEGSTYKMWYWGDDVLTGIDQIGLAVSNDGINWQRAGSGPVIAPDPGIWWQNGEGVGTPHVIRVNSGYVMAYHAADQTGNIRIGLATSSDGLDWKKENEPILDIGDENSWESIGIVTGSFIQDTLHLKLWYLGIDASETIKVGLAISCDDVVFDVEADN